MSSAFPHLSRSFARGLAWWSFGIAQTRGGGRRTIATWFALVLGQPVHTIKQRLYEWCIDAAHKAGTHRQTRDVTTCFAPILAWVLRLGWLWFQTQHLHGLPIPLPIRLCPDPWPAIRPPIS